MSGKARYKPFDDSMKDRMHLIGDGDNPIYIMRKGDVHKLFSKDFFFIFEVWQYFNMGFGLPDGRPWGDQDPLLMKLLLHMEHHYRIHFSNERKIIETLGAR